jgi:hypothetical protein
VLKLAPVSRHDVCLFKARALRPDDYLAVAAAQRDWYGVDGRGVSPKLQIMLVVGPRFSPPHGHLVRKPLVPSLTLLSNQLDR